MPCHINVMNKKTGVTYVYESTSFRDKETKQPRNKRVCIGKLDPASGELIASKRLKPEQAAVRDPAVTASAEVVGPSIILDAITETLGLGQLLKSCFPNNYKQIQAMAYYLSSHGGPLSHCGTWCKSHVHSIGDSLNSQRISEILNTIGMDGKQTFLDRWMDKVLEEGRSS